MKIIRNCLSWLIGFILLLIIPLVNITFSLNYVLLSPYSTIHYLNESHFYESIVETLPNILNGKSEEKTSIEQNNTNQEGVFPYSKDVENNGEFKEQMAQIIKEKITEEWLQEKLTFIQKELWDYILGKDKNLQPVNLSDVRDSFLQSLNVKLENEEAETKKEIIKNFEDKFKEELNWVELYGIKKEKLDKITHFFQIKNKIVIVSYLTILLLILINYLIVWDRKKWITWMGKIFIIASISSVVSYAIWKFYIKHILFKKINFPEIYQPFETNTKNLINLIANDTFMIWFILSAFLFLLGVFSLFQKRKKSRF